jgi:hypothetical protein
LDAGATYVFMRNNGLWTQQAYLKASNTETFDEFGFSVAVDGDTLVVGATREASDSVNVGGSQNNNNAPFAGAAYVFVRSGTSWSQQAYLKASNTGPGDAFGWSVDVRGDQIVVGAQREDSAATGVNGNQGNDDSVDSGAAYLYSRSGSQWASSAYVKASNTDPGDNFGYAVVLSTDGVVVGAPAEDSNATGVNGNQADNQAEEAGAAYTYSQSVGDNLHADGFEG